MNWGKNETLKRIIPGNYEWCSGYPILNHRSKDTKCFFIRYADTGLLTSPPLWSFVRPSPDRPNSKARVWIRASRVITTPTFPWVSGISCLGSTHRKIKRTKNGWTEPGAQSPIVYHEVPNRLGGWTVKFLCYYISFTLLFVLHNQYDTFLWYSGKHDRDPGKLKGQIDVLLLQPQNYIRSTGPFSTVEV